jgi:GMP synthase-like glutamine amidotransferase
MILLLDLCDQERPLSRDEFVLPIAHIVQNTNKPYTIRHYEDLPFQDSEKISCIILCGNALKDNRFLRNMGEFLWLREGLIPILGICAGMQVISKVWGGEIEKGAEIGMTTVRAIEKDPLLEGKEEFTAYELHNFSPLPPDSFQVLAISSQYPQMIRHQSLPIYGVLFHPEVRNEWVVERFLHLFMEEMN